MSEKSATQPNHSLNPILSSDFLLPFDQMRPEHVPQAVDTAIEQANERIRALIDSTPAEFMQRLDTVTEDIDRVGGIVSHLNSVISSKEWQEAKTLVIPKISAFHTEFTLNAELWQALKAFAQTPEAAQLSAVRARHLKLTMDEFKRNGADLPDADKEKLKALNTELAELTNQYANNHLENVAAYELYVPTERLDGVPERVKEATRQDAQKHEQEGHRLTLPFPVLMPILTYAHDRELRRELWEADARTGSIPERDNRPLVKQILALRRQIAQLLGFQDFADYILEDRMAKTGAKALAFERDLEQRTRPAFERETQELTAFAHEHGHQGDLAPWDVTYWAEKQRQEKYDFDAEALRPYFPLEQVLRGMFELCQRIFGIRVEQTTAPVWHPDVQVYTIHDEQNTHLAHFYTDWFPRPSKRAGAWMNYFRIGGPREGGFAPHLGLMCGNMTPPSEDGPALLSLDEVETVFHEFGHLLHHALSRVEVRALSGTNVPWDFVELPSQIMENWVTKRESLDLFAKHYQTGERLPDELYERMIAAKNYRAASTAMRQYSFALTDLMLHVEYDPSSDQDPIVLSRDLMQRFIPVQLPEDYAMIARFGHLFNSPVGYGAGYYSYKWAEVLDADAFSRFEKEGLFSREVGQSYLDTILSQGNSKDPAELFRDFMGRDPDPEALLRRSGLLGSTN